MKKTTLLLAMILILAIMFTACNNKTANTMSSESTTSSHSTTPESSTPAPSQDSKAQDILTERKKTETTESSKQADEPKPTTPSESSDAPQESKLPQSSSEVSASSETPPPAASSESEPQASMSITSVGVNGGVLADEYGMRGKQQKDGVPTLSPPISIKDAPEGTVCFAVIIRDPDSKPLCGYVWTHWLAANISDAVIAKNASIDNAADIVQGKNDFGTTGYGGPTPPDKPHTYIITVYALDARLDLKNGFSEDALEKAMAGHVLAEANLNAKYSN